MKNISFFDLEIDFDTKQVLDIGAIYVNGKIFRGKSIQDFKIFMKDADFIVGHNVFKHDLIYVHKYLGEKTFGENNTIDTLLLSPLLFPSRPYHRLLKDDKLQTDELNNPLNDAIKAQHLFNDLVVAYETLSKEIKYILFSLLGSLKEFSSFFKVVNYQQTEITESIESLILKTFDGKICATAGLQNLIQNSPIPLAYALTLINAKEKYSITPPWLLRNYKEVDVVIKQLRGKPCIGGCVYCNQALNPYDSLKRHFGFSEFRSYDGIPLQENAIHSAIHRESLLAVFPTGGGKSITFQLPALMDGENTKSLTVIISPLQSLMKDQVDNLERKGIVNVVTINGLLDPIERSKAIERV